MRPLPSFASASVSAFAFVFVSAVVAACGSGNSKNGFDVPDGGGSSSGGSSGGSSSGGADGSIGTFGDGSTKDSGPVVPPPTGCDSSCNTAGGSCQNNVCVIVDNPGGVDPGTQTQLQGTGTADATFKWLYPYDSTVFPRGLLPPTFQFDGTAADAMYIHITASGLDYKGYFKTLASPLRQALSTKSWAAVVEAAAGLPDQLEVQVTKISGGQVTGPITEHWPVAQGNVRGTIYYETYGSAIGGAVAIMQISPGATAPVKVNLGPASLGCGNICHTASADGSTLVAARGFGLQDPSGSFSLKSSPPTLINGTPQVYVYGALTPDGSLSMSATGYRTWISGASKLYDTATGANVPATGWDGVIKNAGVGSFSPDGSEIAFVHEDKDQGHTIAKMDFSESNTSFGNLVDLATSTGLVTWPSFTADSKWVVYGVQTSPGSCPGSSGSSSGSTTATAAPFETDCNAKGDLYAVDLATHTPHRLDSLDGYTAGGTTTYLPSNDPDLDFAPTVLPEAVGGFFWVVFTSHRAYGNTLASMVGQSSGNDDEGQLWVAAVDLDPKPGQDPSHPAFYLDGQEKTADNLRGFWVLSPCEAQGESCTSGDQCCEGFCRPAGDGGPLECVPPPGGCSNLYEKCTTASDCCQSSDQCINGFCSQPAAQ
jgi:hypothetical protein